MHLYEAFLTVTLLNCAAWRHFGSAFPDHPRSSRPSERLNFRTDEIGHVEKVHIPENELDPNNRHLVPSNNEKSDGYEDNTVNLIIDFDEAAELDHSTDSSSDEHSHNLTDHEDHAIHVASWQWDYVRTPFIYTAVIIVAGFCKIGFHHAEFLSSILPESCMLIVLGTIVGTIVHFTESREMLPQFTPKAFFLFLLPPIVLESAYSLHDRAFFSNLGTIILYAVIGTIINCFTIGVCLYGLTKIGAMGGLQFHVVECLVFSALISAVDPVAVLAIFQEVGVNKNLYFLVFGESLLNDAVTIVLYMMMVGFSKAEYITAEQVAVGIAAFICVSIGGLGIGIIMGIFTALITKHTEEVRVVEPLAMLGVAYLSYLLAEMVHFSGIISIIGCGIVQAHYASKNISSKSNTTVKYFTKMVSAVCDTVIFLFLGMVLVDDQHVWHTGFVFWSTGLCLIVRFGSVFFLTFCANRLERTHRINTEEQFIMAYGGLRGAVAFSLVIMLDDIEHKNLFTTATLFIILFTVFVQGATIKPLVGILKIRRQAAKDTSSLFTEVNKKVLDHVMAGVEEVTGDHGGNYWKQLLFHYNTKYLKRWLMCKSTESNLTRVYTRMMLEDHFAHLYGPAAAIEDHKPLLLNKLSTDETDDCLEVLPVTEEDLEDQQQEIQVNEVKEESDGIAAKRQSAKFDLQDVEEGRPLKTRKTGRSIVKFAKGAARHLRIPLPGSNKGVGDQLWSKVISAVQQSGEMERNSDTSALPKRPPLLKRQTTLAMFNKAPEDDASKLLQKALLHNPYNKLHQKYNPNLVDDEDQDIQAQLRKRRLRTRRLALLAMHKTDAGTPERRTSTTPEEEAMITNPMVPLAASFFLERAQKRKGFRKESTSSKADEPLSTNKLVKLERQSAVSGLKDIATNGVATIGEEDETEITISKSSTKDSHQETERRKSAESEV